MIKRPIFSPRINIGQRGPAGGATGPGSSTASNIVIFTNTDGQTLSDSGKAHSTDGTLASNSDAKVPTEKAVKTYVDTEVGGVNTDPAAAINAATGKTTPVDADLIGIVDSAASNVLKKLTWENLKATLLTWLRLSTTIIPVNAPQGFLINGKISVTDAAGITVAIKTLAGTDPSATDPVYVRIGDTVRTISAALSVAKADGTNWCNAGSAELATKEIDYFVYLGYNATDGVTIGFSRFPGANSYDDFSATTTNEKYCAISTITTAAATDYYEVIGRFAATLSAGAGYTWSVPTYTAKNLIQRPIYETRWLDYARVVTSGAGTPTTVTNHDSVYKVRDRQVFVNSDNTVTAKGTASSTFIVSLPFTSAGGGKTSLAGREEAATGKAWVGSIAGASATLLDYLNGTLWVDTYRMPISGSYEI